MIHVKSTAFNKVKLFNLNHIDFEDYGRSRYYTISYLK